MLKNENARERKLLFIVFEMDMFISNVNVVQGRNQLKFSWVSK